MAKPATNRTILWIPTLQYLDGKAFESTPQNLQDALKKRGILYEKLYYPMDIAPAAFPFGQDLVIDGDKIFGYPFGQLVFRENDNHRGVYNIAENRMLVPVKLMNIDACPPDDLAEYFKNCWMTHE